MSAKDTAGDPPRNPARSGVQELRPDSSTLGEKLLRLGRKADANLDMADILELYFSLFEEIDPGAFVAIQLLSEHDVALQRASSRLPETSVLSVTRQAWSDAGLGDEHIHPVVQLVDAYQPIKRDGFQVVLANGDSILGIVSCEPSELDDARRTEFQLIAATLAPRVARAIEQPTQTPLGDYVSALIQRAEIPLVLLDSSSRVVMASQAFRRLIGRARLGTKHWSEFVAPRDWERVASATRGGTPVECDLVGVASTLRVGLEFIPLAHPALRGAGTLVIGRDLRILRNLERQVIQAEKLATLGQLAAGVAHELNNPLTSILAYAEYMHGQATKNVRPDKEIAALGRIVESSERMRRFTQSLVAYARPARGSPSQVDVGGLIDEALGFCEHLVRHIDTRVHLNFPPDFSGARGVRASLQQVLINLITNACHAMSHDGHLRIIAGIDDGNVSIHIVDDGPGVPAGLRSEIFEPFFSTKREGEGTGLGLSIVRNILSLQSGTIELDDSFEEGARFIVRLPVWKTDGSVADSNNQR